MGFIQNMNENQLLFDAFTPNKLLPRHKAFAIPNVLLSKIQNHWFHCVRPVWPRLGSDAIKNLLWNLEALSTYSMGNIEAAKSSHSISTFVKNVFFKHRQKSSPVIFSVIPISTLFISIYILTNFSRAITRDVNVDWLCSFIIGYKAIKGFLKSLRCFLNDRYFLIISWFCLAISVPVGVCCLQVLFSSIILNLCLTSSLLKSRPYEDP